MLLVCVMATKPHSLYLGCLILVYLQAKVCNYLTFKFGGCELLQLLWFWQNEFMIGLSNVDSHWQRILKYTRPGTVVVCSSNVTSLTALYRWHLIWCISRVWVFFTIYFNLELVFVRILNMVLCCWFKIDLLIHVSLHIIKVSSGSGKLLCWIWSSPIYSI